MMKIAAYCGLHYGLDYLEYAIRSVIDQVSEFHILYSPHPSHGTHSHLTCPDDGTALQLAAIRAAGNKLHWHGGEWKREHEQRSAIYQYVDADAIIVVDSDEIYAENLISEALDFGFLNGCRYLRLPFIHLWRSFSKGFAHDPAYPERIIFPQQFGKTLTLPTDKRIWHFGYAQRSEIVRYKMNIHGHVAEFRKDVNWFEDVFMANRQIDCHPVGSQYWNVEAIDLSQLPSVLENHPYRHLEFIP